MDREIKHSSHEHPLFLNEERKIGGESKEIILKCEGCLKPISGPFYSCSSKQCGIDYVLHKVCAELPPEMNHPMHSQHRLTFLSKPHHKCTCDLCGGICERFMYYCSECSFAVDITCASASHRIEDKCHSHPLTPLQLSISFPCIICRTEEKGFSFKCDTCPFWAHQNCTLMLPRTVKHTDHRHPLTLLPSLAHEIWKDTINCDICHSQLHKLCVYSCEGCLYFSHANCATSETRFLSAKNTDEEVHYPILLPVRKESTDLILQFVESHTVQENLMTEKIIHFDHCHSLILLDRQINDKICEACIQPISAPTYGCIECNYFLHKCCAELPRQIVHLFHSIHQVELFAHFPHFAGTFMCQCCNCWCNGFGYICPQCAIVLDIKCASMKRPVKHEAHKHALVPRILSAGTCSACEGNQVGCSLQCDKCNYSIHQGCAMLPPTIMHRYDKHPFILKYSPIESHFNEYYCEICENELNPKFWFYHCGLCDQFIHPKCMLSCAADMNIKYGETYRVHKSTVCLVPLTHDYSNCYICGERLNVKFCVGVERASDNLRCHFLCFREWRKLNSY